MGALYFANLLKNNIYNKKEQLLSLQSKPDT